MGKLTISTGPFSIAMLVYQRVHIQDNTIPSDYPSPTILVGYPIGNNRLVIQPAQPQGALLQLLGDGIAGRAQLYATYGARQRRWFGGNSGISLRNGCDMWRWMKFKEAWTDLTWLNMIINILISLFNDLKWVHWYQDVSSLWSVFAPRPSASQNPKNVWKNRPALHPELDSRHVLLGRAFQINVNPGLINP